MKIQEYLFQRYSLLSDQERQREGLILKLIDEEGNIGYGEVAPLPGWSKETLEDSKRQLEQIKKEILIHKWVGEDDLKQLSKFKLFPSVFFGLEAALFSLLFPLPPLTVNASALLMGSVAEILEQASKRSKEGFQSAKLKVGHLSFEEAAFLIDQLKDRFYLRIDVNRAWSLHESLRFFSQFPLDAFDYVEEPFQNPLDLEKFSHPLAVDESFPGDLSLKQLERLECLKALIYKPTLQGGMSGCLPLYQWALSKGVQLVLSSSFESDLGLYHIAAMAHRLRLNGPVGLGTYHHFSDRICKNLWKFSDARANPPCDLTPRLLFE